ncbi:TPA: M28 family peptidase [Candidatus Poribacteria bacterium]|nr:M28 family peptidase [Candidatus Poribacteria bacterium]HIC03806.1 M28 family peptidase [Candidatus Poribacteria bacterium]HIN29689.1 M28 family peptidase [Candidatus Poribacteria bacterium]HIO81805.1 M28 family peptidase [Candidatus Poribacteria bacterium]
MVSNSLGQRSLINLHLALSSRLLWVLTLKFLLLPHSWAAIPDELIASIQSENLRSHIVALQENIDRNTGKVYRTRNALHRHASDNSANYITNQFRRSPQLKIGSEEFSGMRNVIAKLPSWNMAEPNRIFILCAHYDSKANRDPNWNPLISKAPGANDNGTGVAIMLEIARILSAFKFNCELRFIAFDGKEVGLIGSQHHAKKAAESGEHIVATFNIDMIGFNWINDQIDIVTNNRSSWMAEFTRIINNWFDFDLEIHEFRDDLFGYSDHKPFWDQGYDAVTLVENITPWRDSRGYEANPFYHTSKDTVDKINLNLVTKVARLALAVLYNLASRDSVFLPSKPLIAFDPLPPVNQSPFKIKGRILSPFPLRITIEPRNLIADIDRANRVYSALVSLKNGINHVKITATDAIQTNTLEQQIEYQPDFEWISTIVYPNPSYKDLVTFRAESNRPVDSMQVAVHQVDGTLVRQISGVADRSTPKIWRAWWNRKITYGIEVATAVYICKFEVESDSRIHARHQKLVVVKE